MSLVLKANSNESNAFSYFNFYDKTGLYKSTDPNKNLTGWNNASTALLADATAATVVIMTPNDKTLLPTNGPVTIDVFSTLPNVVNTPFQINASDLGYTDNKLPDGYYKMLYSVTVTGFSTPFTYTLNQIVFGQVQCCINKALADVDVCGCSADMQTKLLYACLLLKAIKRQIAGGRNEQAISTLKELQNICAKNLCKDC